MEKSRYSLKPNAGKGLSGFITNFSVAGEFDPAGWIQTDMEGICYEKSNVSDPAWLDPNCFDECQGESETAGIRWHDIRPVCF